MEKIIFDVTYTPEDMYQASRLNYKDQHGRLAVPYLAIIFFVVSFIPIGLDNFSRILFLILAVVAFIFPYIYIRLTAKRTLEGMGFSQNHFVIDDSGVENKYDQGSSKNTWDEIVDIRYNKKMLLIYIAKYRFFIIPKRVVTSSQWDELIKAREMITPKETGI
jgi:hypothetical protein